MLTELKCVSYISASPKRHGVLHAVLGTAHENASFVQEMNEIGEITDFIEFSDFDNFHSSFSLTSPIVTLGSEGLVAFYLPDGSLHETTVPALRKLIVHDEELLSKLPTLTQIHIQRLTSPKRLYSGELFAKFCKEHNLNEKASSIFFSANLRTIQEGPQIWARIKEIPEPIRPDVDDNKIHADLEDLIRDLFSTHIDDSWIVKFVFLLRNVAFDDRLLELGERFISDDTVDFFKHPSSPRILSRLMDLASYIASGSLVSDFWDALVDPISSGEICSAIDAENIAIIGRKIDDLYSSEVIKRDSKSIFLDELDNSVITHELASAILDYLLRLPDVDIPEWKWQDDELSLRDLIKHTYEANPRLQLVTPQVLAGLIYL